MAKLIFKEYKEENEEKEFEVVEEKDLEINSNKDKDYSLLIEGDNLNSLQYLKEQGTKVDVIYIDPPYNTGKLFNYNDTKNEDEWLSFMKKRLKLSYELLDDDGVIFVSIDDYSYAQLKLLMDDIYGIKNYINTLVWRRSNGINYSNFLKKQKNMF